MSTARRVTRSCIGLLGLEGQQSALGPERLREEQAGSRAPGPGTSIYIPLPSPRPPDASREILRTQRCSHGPICLGLGAPREQGAFIPVPAGVLVALEEQSLSTFPNAARPAACPASRKQARGPAALTVPTSRHV